jgi:hypothetical protein
MLVRIWEVRGRRHCDRCSKSNSWSEWWFNRKRSIRVCSGLRVLAAHHQARWDLGLVFVTGGHERPDARVGAVWRAIPVEGPFLIAMVIGVFSPYRG